MNAINNLVNKIGNGFSCALDIAAYTVTHNEPLEKVAKITARIISIAELAFNILSDAISNLKSQLLDTIIVFETLRFVGAVNLLVCPQKNGKYFLVDSENSWQKRVDRVNLAFHCAFKSFKGLNRFGFVSMGVLAKDAIGKLPFFTLIMDTFMLGSCTFSAWDNLGVNFPKARKNYAEADTKIIKWESRQTEIAYLKANIESECIHFESRYSQKANELDAELAKYEKKDRLNADKLLRANEPTQLPKAKQEKLISECEKKTIKYSRITAQIQRKQLKNDGRLEKIAAKNFRGLGEDLEKTNITYKLKVWEVRKANASQIQSKVWLRVANSVAKFTAICLAFTLTALSFWTVPASLALFGMGVLTDSIGLSKLLVEEFWKAKPIPTNFAAPAV